MRIAGLTQESIVDGPGLRFAVFTQGCDLTCEGCHNPEARNTSSGIEMPVNEIIAKMLSNPLTDGLTLSGGEPIKQVADCLQLALAAHGTGLNVWVFSGYTFEELIALAPKVPAVKELLGLIDVLVDGRFVLAQRTLELKWRGSRNQRVIDMPRSLAAGRAIELEV